MIREVKTMLDIEKYWNNPSIYEYNIMDCTVSCWILGEHGDREWVVTEGLIWLKHNIYIYIYIYRS
jgi:hypothetical protein